jgi:Holliday junction resolvasome RuvABC DNA-binding subunit
MQWIKINESKANVLKNSKTARKLFVKLKNKSGRHESLMAEKERNDHSRSCESEKECWLLYTTFGINRNI